MAVWRRRVAGAEAPPKGETAAAPCRVRPDAEQAVPGGGRQGNPLSPARRRRCIERVRQAVRISERRPGRHRQPCRSGQRPLPDEAPLEIPEFLRRVCCPPSRTIETPRPGGRPAGRFLSAHLINGIPACTTLPQCSRQRSGHASTRAPASEPPASTPPRLADGSTALDRRVELVPGHFLGGADAKVHAEERAPAAAFR